MTIKQYHPSRYLCSLTNFERYQFLIHPTVQDFAVYHSVHHSLLIQFLKDIIHFFIQLCTFTTLAFSTLSVRNLRPLFNTNIPPLVGDTASETLLAIGNWFSREEKWEKGHNCFGPIGRIFEIFIFGILSTNPTTWLKQDCYLFCLAKIGSKLHVPRKTKWWAVVLVVLILSIHSYIIVLNLFQQCKLFIILLTFLLVVLGNIIISNMKARQSVHGLILLSGTSWFPRSTWGASNGHFDDDNKDVYDSVTMQWWYTKVIWLGHFWTYIVRHDGPSYGIAGMLVMLSYLIFVTDARTASV